MPAINARLGCRGPRGTSSASKSAPHIERMCAALPCGRRNPTASCTSETEPMVAASSSNVATASIFVLDNSVGLFAEWVDTVD